MALCYLCSPTKGQSRLVFLCNSHNISIMSSTQSFICGLCGLVFTSKKRRQSHRSVHHQPCNLCRERFDGLQARQQHQRETNHCFCSVCNSFFSKAKHHILHVRNVQHNADYSCCDCGRDYPSTEYLDRHCCKCDQLYRSPARLERHFRSNPKHKLHPQVARVEVEPATPQHECNKCCEVFATKKLLKKHKRTHKPARNILCPAGASCKKKFALPSALLSHLESGRCRSGMTRARLNTMVISNDAEGYIVNRAAIEDLSTPK